MENQTTFSAVKNLIHGVKTSVSPLGAHGKQALAILFATAEVLAAALVEATYTTKKFVANAAAQRNRFASTAKALLVFSAVAAPFSTVQAVETDSPVTNAYPFYLQGLSADSAERWLSSDFIAQLAEVIFPNLEIPEEIPNTSNDAAGPEALAGTEAGGNEQADTTEYQPISIEDASAVIGRDVPLGLYLATQNAIEVYEERYSERYPNCGITVEFLLATAHEETGAWWGRIRPDGNMVPALTNAWDASGPFQFTSEAWAHWHPSGDVQNAYDSASASMRYHCSLAVDTYNGSLDDMAVAWNVAADYHDGPRRDRQLSERCVAGVGSDDYCLGESYASRRTALLEELLGLESTEITVELAAEPVRS